MGKTYIDTVKYTIHSKFSVDGLVEKPDVVGAIFGQTEGLLGEELDLRDLQKNGRIGRIEVNTSNGGGRTTGLIKIPSSLDRIETAVIAAAMETVDRVGPCDAKFEIERIEDNRDAKRKKIIDKAKSLFKDMLNDQIPDSKEIIELVRSDVRMDETVNYGNDKLVASKGMEKSDEIIVVEGRADVLNLLRNDIDNVVAIGGARITPSIVELTKKKDVTVFLDGDRGGDIILNELVSAGAEIDFVARAPAGTEVEELTRKELIKALRNKIPFGQYFNEKDMSNIITKRQNEEQRHPQQSFSQRMRDSNSPQQQQHQPRPYYQPQHQQQRQERPQQPAFDRGMNSEERQRELKEKQMKEAELQQMEFAKSLGAESFEKKKEEMPAERIERPAEKMERMEEKPERIQERQEKAPERAERVPEKIQEKPAEPAVPKEKVEMGTASLMIELNKIIGQSKAKIYNGRGELASETYVRDMIKALDESHEPHAIVFDGIVTQRLVDIAAQKGTKYLVGLRAGNVRRVPETLSMVTLQ